MSELDKAKDVSKLGQVSSADKIEGSKDDLKLSQKIDFTKYPNLERVSPDDLEALVTDENGNLLPEEGLKAADKTAGEKNTDGVQKSYDEDFEAVKKLGCYHLLMQGKFSKAGAEALHDEIHDKDGKLISEDKIKELDEQVRVEADAAIKKSDEEKKNEEAHSNLTSAYEKNKGIDEETEAVNKEFQEVLGEDAYKEMKDKAQEEKEASGQKENNADADLNTEEGRNEFIKNVSQINETLDKKIDFDNDKSDDIAVKYYRTDEKEEALEQAKEALEQAKAAKTEQEKTQKQTESTQGAGSAQAPAQGAQSADPDAAAKDADKLQEYIKSDSAKNAQSGKLYADNTAFVKQTVQEDKLNDARNANNDKYYNKQQDENLKALYEKQAGLVFERGEGNKNDLSTLLAGAEDGKKLTAEDMKEKIKGSKEEDTSSPMGKPGEEKEFDPYNATEDAGDSNTVAGLDNSSESTGSSSQLQFDKSSADETDDVAEEINDQAAGEKETFDARIEKEKGRADGIEKDTKTQGEMQEILLAKVQPTDQAANNTNVDYAGAATAQGEVNNAKAEAGKNITNIQKKDEANLAAQGAHTADQNTQGDQQGALSTSLAAASAALELQAAIAAARPNGEGQATAAALRLKAAALRAASELARTAEQLLHKEGAKSAAYEDTLKQQQAAAEQTKQALAAEQAKIAAANQKEYDEVTKPVGDAIMTQYQDYIKSLIASAGAQTKQIAGLEAARDKRLDALAKDKETILAKKQAATEDKEAKPAENKEVKASENNKEVKETKEGAVANAGDKAGQDKKAESKQEKVFEFKENEDVKQDDMKEQFANPLMADKKEAKDAKDAKQGPQSVLANAGAPKIGVDSAIAENEESEEDKDGIANVQFKAYSKENKITKEVLGVEDDRVAKVDTSEKQPKTPELRRASRFAKTAEKVNGVDGTAAKGFTA